MDQRRDPKKSEPQRELGLDDIKIFIVLDCAHASCFRPFAALSWLVLYALPIVEALETLRVDVGVMDEEIVAAVVRGDKPKTFLIAEPLYCTRCHFASP